LKISNEQNIINVVNKQLLKDGLGWGILLWFIGYLLGIILFMAVPKTLIGWVIMPVGIAITLWVLLKKVKAGPFSYYLKVAIIWTFVAVVFDYYFLVKVFKPEDGYYKLDVYLYYAFTFILPSVIGWYKTKIKK
jgi:hypothetical protein